MKRWLRVMFLLGCAMACPVTAQTDRSATPPDAAAGAVSQALKVGVKIAPPFVIEEDGQFSGLAIELWEEVAAERGWTFEYTSYDLQALLDAVAAHDVDIGIGAITATAEREHDMDFSHPITSSGLGVAVRSGFTAGWVAVVQALFSTAFLQVIGILVLVLLAVGVLIWWFEHDGNPDQFGGNPRRGIFAGFWWAMVTMTTVGYGDLAPRSITGRILGMVWMLTALIIVSFFTAAITSALTVGQLSQRVEGAEDLAGMQIATVPGSTSATWLEREGLAFEPFDDLPAALEALVSGTVDVVVYDAPLLRWQIAQTQAGLQVLPIRLERQDYGFALPEGSTLSEPLNVSLLRQINAPGWNKRLAEYFDAK